MPKYLVNVLEVWNRSVIIDASTEEEAKRTVRNGGGEDQEDSFEYIECLPEEDWLVEELEDRCEG